MRVQVIILAAGQGKRFGAPYPKVLAPLDGKPMVVHVVAAARRSRVTQRPVVVIGAGADQVRAAVGPAAEFVLQREPLGTGHAVRMALPHLAADTDAVVVLYGDMPLVSSQTIRDLVATHAATNAVLTMATVTVPDFADWRASFASFGRIVRDAQGNLARIVEARDATAAERQLTEVNPSLFCFQVDWLRSALPQVTNRNAQGEYYLTDLLALAIAHGQVVQSLPVDPREAMGVNDAVELNAVRQLAAI